ncbi:MAG: LamG-like jellyroll fold domain-containing protein [Phycisphaerales bacterium]
MCKRKTYWRVALVALAAFAVAGSVVQADVNPVGWWPLDDGAGTTVADSSANANNGVITGDAAWTTGQFGGALSFDGTDDFVTLPIGSIISELSDTTITTWANFSNAGGAWQRLWDFGSGTGIYMFLCARVNTDGVIRFAIRTASVGEQIVNTPDRLASGWHNVTVVMDSADMMSRVYVDGAMVASGATVLLPKDLGVTTQNWLGKSQWPDALYQGDLDDVRIYNRVLTQDEIKNVMVGGAGYGLANTPSPADGQTNLLPNVTLSWAAGQEGETHDVYFGTSAADVAAADAANPLGVLVSSGQAGTTFDAGRLEFGKTYSWRVDEIGPAPDFTVYKGNVWSFTVEPYAYTLGAASITATASSVNEDTMGPGKTIDGSGLNADGQHSVAETDMWLSSQDGPEPAWIQYEFDRAYLLNDMLVWNSNLEIESVIGYGAKDVKVEYSLDGVAWTSVGDFEFAQAPGEATYTTDTKVDFAGTPARFVKLTINSNWGGVLPQYGLSEVRFTYIPVSPTNLSPVAGTLDLESPVTLSWRPGRQAVTHEIYLGTDPNALPLAATTEAATYVADVAMGNVYYWKVVEVNEAADPTRWESDVASFSTVAIPKDPGVDNLTHRYTFDDGTANDSAGDVDGTLVGGAAVVDGALVISAQDQWMEMSGSAIAMNTYEAVSLVARYTPKAGANTGYTMLAYFGDSVGGLGSNGFFFSPARGDNVSRAAISIGNTSAPWTAESGANGVEYDDGKSHFVVVTLDATTIKLYFEGELIASAPLSETNKISGISQNFAYLAKGGYTGDPEWIGAIHEFSIYNKALSAGEILFLAQAQPKDPGADALKHQYTFEDGTANDSVGQAHGTLVGGATVADGALLTTAQDQWMEMSGAEIAMNTYEAVSVVAWFTPTAGANTGYHMVCYFGDSLNGFGSNGIFYTPARGNNVSRAGISCGNTAAPWGAETGVDGPEIDDGNLHFVVATIDGTSVTLYQDGVLCGTATLSAANKLSAVSTNFAYLAKGGYTGDPEWLGQIHEFRIYNRALTVGEANYLFGQR